MLIITVFNGKLKTAFFTKTMYNDRSCLYRGDTTPPQLSLSSLYLNLDFRVIVNDINADELDVVTGELARQSSTNP